MVVARIAVALVLVAMMGGCAPPPIDPGDQTILIQFENDLGRPVVLKLCADDKCHGFDYSDEIEAGDSHPENIYFGGGFISRWVVADPAGKALGCMPIELRYGYEHERAPLSLMVPCPGDAPIAIPHSGPRLNQFGA